MCGRFARFAVRASLEELFGIPLLLPAPPRFNVAPGQPALAVRRDVAGRHEFAEVQWGFNLQRARYNEPVWDIIQSRFPVSLFYGVLTLIITYAVSVPLGVVKAIKHRTAVDNITSVIIFAGYAVPGYVLGSLLLLYFSVRLE